MPRTGDFVRLLRALHLGRLVAETGYQTEFVGMSSDWHTWLRYTGAALIVGTGLLLTGDLTFEIVGGVVFLTANIAYLARWLIWVKNGDFK